MTRLVEFLTKWAFYLALFFCTLGLTVLVMGAFFTVALFMYKFLVFLFWR